MSTATKSCRAALIAACALLGVLGIGLAQASPPSGVQTSGSGATPPGWGNSSGGNRPSVRGSQTIAAKSNAVLSYDDRAPRARQKGSKHGVGVDGKRGFRCAGNKEWAVVQGVIQCADRLTLDPGAAGLLNGSKTLYVRSRLAGGFISGILLRLTGTDMELRADMFSLDGSVTGSCFVTAEQPTCHLGSPNAAHPGLAAVPKFASDGGVLRYADDLVGGNRLFTGSLAGGSLQDAYIASVTISQSHLDVSFVGLHFLDGSQGSNKMRPIYSSGRLGWEALAGMMGSSSEVIWTTGSAWNANTP